jgi:hypothetical protein
MDMLLQSTPTYSRSRPTFPRPGRATDASTPAQDNPRRRAPVPLHPSDELERQCAAMLAQGIIRPSMAAFSASVLLVKKADNTRCFCVDYRTLNEKTVKDKYPISVVDELDELHGAQFFSQLNYHKVRVHPDDIEKTTFHTYHDHFEFLVMPFWLSNGLSTF